VLNVTALGPTPGDARDRAYQAAGLISFEGMQMRADIAARAVEKVATRQPDAARESVEKRREKDPWR
jgi:hypothetical protein